MALKASKMSRFCRLAELAYVETGKQGDRIGHWFLSFKGKRLFFTDEDIHTRLERRKLTLFAGGQEVIPTAVAPAAAPSVPQGTMPLAASGPVQTGAAG